MGRIISKIHGGREIVIGEISVKKNHNPDNRNEMVTIFKVFHSGIGSEEDLFVFSFNPLLQDWVLQLDKCFICIDILSNHKLLDEVYSKLSPSKVITIQEFTNLIYDEHFQIFVETNPPIKVDRLSWLRWIKKFFRR